MTQFLATTAQQMSVPGKGILAADESTQTITKRFNTINVESTEEHRRRYRELLFTTPGINEFLHGVILYEETLYQKTSDGTPFPEYLAQLGILPGIKVDKGLIDLALADNEKITQGLDGLAERLASYRDVGARFAKWRAIYTITDSKPSKQAIAANAEVLARYAAICQTQDIVPIVEPEVLIDGDHTIERCYEVTQHVLKAVFEALARHRVALEHIILKPSMVIAGNQCATQAPAKRVAELTYQVLKENVPAAVPAICFLSGGQSDEQATEHLQLMNDLFRDKPWELSYSYGRALQAPCLKAWLGKEENVASAQQALHKRCLLNSRAALGEYAMAMEEA
tara:strand:+ start:523 stop:1539 length:1017 start_codon:yes stop_codon:yes gene_type:complete